MKNWLIQTPVPVFIDNSVWRALAFNLENTFFTTLLKGVNSRDIVIAYTDISKEEFLKHCEELLREDQKRLEKLTTLKSMFSEELKELEAAVSELTASQIWQKFESKFSPINISCAVDWKPIFKDYFEIRPPFSDKKRMTLQTLSIWRCY